MRNRGRNKRIKPVGVEVGVGVGLKGDLEVEAPLTVILILMVIWIIFTNLPIYQDSTIAAIAAIYHQ